MFKRSQWLAALLCFALLFAMLAGCAPAQEPGEEPGDDSTPPVETPTVYTVTFDLNYDGAPAGEQVEVEEGESVAEPADPVRDGYTFYAWYTDASCVEQYDFSQAVTEDTTLYAFWEEEGANYCTVTYHVNYAGGTDYTQRVQEGERAVRPTDIAREGYGLFGWYTDEACTEEFSFGRDRITADTDLYALWGKEEVFEAEYVDFDDLEGPGYSGSAMGTSMILRDTNDVGASNGFFVSYLYKEGITLEFNIVSDAAVDNAQLTLRLSAEVMDNLTINGRTYAVYVNDTMIDYSDIVFTGITGSGTSGVTKAFEDYLLSSSVHLNEGANVIRLVTNNSDPMGGTMTATAPVVDCIKICSLSALTWGEGFPIESNIENK